MIDFPASPTTGQIFTAAGSSWRYDGTKWVAYGAGQGNAGRSLIHNGQFNVAQRGPGPWTGNGSYTADRWALSFVGGTLSTSITAISDASRAQIGDEAAVYQYAVAVAGGSGTSDESFIEQRIEGVRRSAGKTVTLSFWAAANAGTPKLGMLLYQIFGTGGSPSAAVATAGQAVTLSTTYTRYSLTFAVPSAAGKSFGTTAGTDYLTVRFGLSAGSSTTGNYGGIGVQSYTLALWGVQLEIGTQATPLEKPDPRYDLANCQRFYSTVSFRADGGGTSGIGIYYPISCPVSMRATPTVTPTFTLTTNITGPNVTGAWLGGLSVGGVTSATAYQLAGIANCSADL